MISVVYDGHKGLVDGDKAAELTGNMVMQFCRLNIGQNWEDMIRNNTSMDVFQNAGCGAER
jgi:hypothetical protein